MTGDMSQYTDTIPYHIIPCAAQIVHLSFIKPNDDANPTNKGFHFKLDDKILVRLFYGCMVKGSQYTGQL